MSRADKQTHKGLAGLDRRNGRWIIVDELLVQRLQPAYNVLLVLVRTQCAVCDELIVTLARCGWTDRQSDVSARQSSAEVLGTHDVTMFAVQVQYAILWICGHAKRMQRAWHWRGWRRRASEAGSSEPCLDYLIWSSEASTARANGSLNP